ncbi:hypothetical protein [Mycolicibacterium pyrenivorans]|uniref:hypothetical protein n=1 Tax=Mycolicibacterium pyrenivorans TaxID=187102 RepID=UPI0021F31C6F|nr:hypothetical protein [Mycolicibacterium pyrenivorans]MCV7151807.1 hypothetical protein [Mycolicibacterium pyrenivorans]
MAIAAVIACLGGAAIYAATDQPTPAIGPPGHHAFDPASGAGPAGPGHPGGPPRQTPP